VRLGLFALSLALALPAASEAGSALDATVFIRVSGELKGEYQHAWKETVEVRDVEIATGSGFVISPGGYILTNHHVVASEDRLVEHEGRQVRVEVHVTRVEVLFPADGTRLEARVEATDPDLDLAVLSVSGVDLPFLGLGDSDALQPGQPIQVTGFPLGRALEVGRPSSADTVPQPTVSRGSVAALRTGDQGDARYIQTDAAVHPGSSGGPMVDEQGYAVGVIRMAIGRRSGLAFAIPINRVKDFLQSAGYERVFPARRLSLGGPQSFDRKGLRMRVPDAFEDTARSRLRVDWAPPDDVGLHVERVATPLTLPEVEAALLAGRDFPGFAAATAAAGRQVRMGRRSALLGWAQGSSPEGDPLELGYAIVDLGAEKVVARYAGPPAQVAFNRSVFVGSLQSLEADPLLTAEVSGTTAPSFDGLTLPDPARPSADLPAGWYQEPGEFSACTGLPPPDGTVAFSPEGDFTVSVRLGWWRSAAREQAAAACGAARGLYRLRTERLGLVGVAQGSFLARADGVWGVELAAPAAKESFLRERFRAWLDALTADPARNR
jgi:trypsin-like peptidase